mgnify:CR=1 FL=1
MNKDQDIIYCYFPLNIKSIKQLIKLIYRNKSPIRIFHNFFLNNIEISGKAIDLGCGNHSSYLNYIKNKSKELYFADKIKKDIKNYCYVDLEKKLCIDNETFDSVILFNVLEHIQNYKELIREIHRITKKRGNFEIFVPFMHKYHPDPIDVFRPTHAYLHKILEEAGFEVKTYLIGVGPLSVFSEIIIKYFKFKFLKILALLILLILDKIIKIFSKDYNYYYNGIHCSCKKI